MAVAREVSAAVMHEELDQVRALARLHKWGIVPRSGELSFLVTMYSYNSDLFIVEVTCDDYKEKPPLFEFIDPQTGERGTRRAYPNSNDSLFHDSGPCICAPFNRKAYKSFVETGPHAEWSFGDWTTSTANGCTWSNFSKLGDMLGLIQSRLSKPETYKGRKG